MKAFIRNQVGQIVFPSNFFPRLDFSVFDSLAQLEAVIHRDFEAKAPTGTDLLARAESGAYGSRFELLRDLALNLLWVDRFAITMYERRPTRWRDVPRQREDLFLPLLTPWVDGERKVAAIEACYMSLPATWDAAAEDHIFSMIFDVFRHRRFHATELPAIPPTVSQALAEPTSLTLQLDAYEPDYPTCAYDAIVDCHHAVPELEALLRQAMVLHNQYPWPRERPWTRLPAARARSERSSSARAPTHACFRRWPPGYPASWVSTRPTPHTIWSPHARACPMASPKRCACFKRSTGPCSWSAPKSSPTRSAPSDRRA